MKTQGELTSATIGYYFLLGNSIGKSRGQGVALASGQSWKLDDIADDEESWGQLPPLVAMAMGVIRFGPPLTATNCVINIFYGRDGVGRIS